MVLTRILTRLEGSDASGIDADKAARLGFVEWAFSVPGGPAGTAARAALACPEVQNAGSAAAQAFVRFLEQATRPVCARHTRKRRLH